MVIRYLTRLFFPILLLNMYISSSAALSNAEAAHSYPEIRKDFEDPRYQDLGIERVQHGISIASGTGVAKILPFRIGIQRSFGRRLCPKKSNEDWPIGGYWEASVNTMRGKPGPYPHSPRQMDAVSAAGVFRVERRCPFQGIWPYLDIGIGVSWISKKEISGRELGIHFQFEDRLGLGFRFGPNREYDLCYRAVHFSNAYLHSRNGGVNLHLIVLGYWFG